MDVGTTLISIALRIRKVNMSVDIIRDSELETILPEGVHIDSTRRETVELALEHSFALSPEDRQRVREEYLQAQQRLEQLAANLGAAVTTLDSIYTR